MEETLWKVTAFEKVTEFEKEKKKLSENYGSIASKAHSPQYNSLPSGSFTDFNECYQIKF